VGSGVGTGASSSHSVSVLSSGGRSGVLSGVSDVDDVALLNLEKG